MCVLRCVRPPRAPLPTSARASTVYALLGYHEIDAVFVKRLQAFLGSVDDRFLVHVEAGIDEHARYVIDVAWHAKTVIVQRKDATNGGDNVNIPARPVGDAQHFIDREPRNVTAPALCAPESLFLYGGDQAIVVKNSGRSVVQTGLER